MEKSAKVLAVLLSGMMLSGCSRLTLEQRTFIRDIIIRETVDGVSVALWQEEEEKLTQGEGKTIKEAMHRAEQQLEGEPFYGQNQRIILDATLSWRLLKECGTYFATEESRMPNVSLWFGQTLPESDGCKEYLNRLESLEDQYSLTANLYELTRREDAVVLPGFDGEDIFAVAKAENKTLEWNQPYAFLTLMMAQQLGSGSVELGTLYGELLFEARGITAAIEAERDEILVRIKTRNANWKLLDSTEILPKEVVQDILKENAELWMEEILNQRIDLFLLSKHLQNADRLVADLLKQDMTAVPVRFLFECR